jgi:YidC/Oxa1 family membrane protein insertase
MDRTGIIAVILCVLAYFVLVAEFNKIYPPAHLPIDGTRSAPTNAAPATPATAPETTSANPLPAPTLAAPNAPVATPNAPEKLNFLENDDVKVTFTTHGASIKQIELKKHHGGRNGGGNVVLNEESHNNVMAVSGWPGADSTDFQVQSTPNSLTYTTTLSGGVNWTRAYTLGADYVLTVKDTLANTGTTNAVLPAYSISVGRAEPLLVHGRYQTASAQYIGAGWLTTKTFHVTNVYAFNPGGWFFAPTPGRDMFTSTTIDPNPLRWLASEDQFFAILLTPDATHPMAQATFQCFNTRDVNGKIPLTDEPNIEAFADFPELNISPGHTVALDYSLYTGPKDYSTLNALGDNQGELMNYNGFLPFALLIVPMLWVLHSFNSIVHSYGLAIILLTLLIKGITWPLQSFANRSAKRMQALAPKIKELQAKYKEQPEKLSSETFALYRDFGVNPVGGCLPAFVQMPVFFSLFYMLQNAVELRGQHFFWVKDLTQPDTIFSHALPFTFLTISHITINPLPILVTALMAVMMRMTPQMGDPQQQKIMQFMPLFFLFLFYNFAAALSLYYVINNAVSIIQIYRNLRKPLPDLKRNPKKATGRPQSA